LDFVLAHRVDEVVLLARIELREPAGRLALECEPEVLLKIQEKTGGLPRLSRGIPPFSRTRAGGQIGGSHA
jgi:hypothetical protein